MRPMGNSPGPGHQEGPRVNERIRVPQVRLISAEGDQLGLLSVQEAMRIAQDEGLDLVEISPDAKPPVCRLMDYGKFKYQQSKKAHESKKKQATVEVKEMSITPNIDTHDLLTKQNHIRRWIEDKSRVRITVKFRGREMAHTDLGHKALNELIGGLSDIVATEAPPKMEGRRLMVTVLPKADAKKAPAPKPAPTTRIPVPKVDL